jgi:hypothetical protein
MKHNSIVQIWERKSRRQSMLLKLVRRGGSVRSAELWQRVPRKRERFRIQTWYNFKSDHDGVQHDSPCGIWGSESRSSYRQHNCKEPTNRRCSMTIHIPFWNFNLRYPLYNVYILSSLCFRKLVGTLTLLNSNFHLRLLQLLSSNFYPCSHNITRHHRSHTLWCTSQYDISLL